MDVIRHNYPLLQPVLEIDGIRLLDPKDIAAMKIGATAARGSKKDFIDLCFLLRHFSLNEILEFHKEKYAQNEMFFILKSLVWFEDAEIESNLNMLMPMDWDTAKKIIREEVEKLT